MKKVFYPLLFVIMTSLAFQSCSSDDDNNSGSSLNNEVSLNGTIYSLNTTGSLESYGENNDGSFDWDVELFSTDINVYFDLNTNSQTGLVEGTYTYSPNRAAFTYVDSEFYIEDGPSYSPTQGTINIDINGDTTTITFNLVTQVDGEDFNIEGEWSGTLILAND